MLHCPLLHHIVKPSSTRSPSAYAAASKCVEAAIETIRVADAMQSLGVLHEAYAFTVDILAMAATSLLVVELGSPGDPLVDRTRTTGRTAQVLLQGLAVQNCSAARCLDSLTVS